MFKKKFSIIVFIIVLLLSGCGKNENSNNDEIKKEIPSGLWALRYVGNEKGEYVEEFNMVEDFYGRPVNFMEMMTVDYGEVSYMELDEEGKGTYYGVGSRGNMDVSFKEDTFMLGDEEKTYTKYGNKLWFEDGEGYYSVYEKVSAELLEKIKKGAYDCVDFSSAEIGDLVVLGEYDTAPGNDRNEVLKWRVIDKDGDKLLLLCDKLIDSFSFNYNPDQTNLDSVTWENCSLRAFLNDPQGFLSMFTDEEVNMMQVTHLENKAANEELLKYWGDFHDIDERKTYSDLAKQHATDGPDTDDKVFLLSFTEVEKYFGEASEPSVDDEYPFSDMPRNSKWVATVTKTVEDNGQGYYNRETLGGAWLTRTLSTAHDYNGMMATYISGDGQVFNYFTYVPLFIRPAVWIKTK